MNGLSDTAMGCGAGHQETDDWETGNRSYKLQDCEEAEFLGGLNIKHPSDALVSRTSLTKD